MSVMASDVAGSPRQSATCERAARRALIAGAAIVLGGVGLVFVHYFGGTPGDPEGWFAAVGFGAPFVAAGLLALIGVRLGAPWMWWASGLAVFPCALVSIVMFPLVVPAAFLLAAGFSERSPVSRNVLGGVFAAALVASFAVIVFHQDPASWPGGSSSNIVTTTEAALAIAVGAAVLAVGWIVGSRDRRRQPSS